MTTLFVSHSTKDKDWALRLHEALRAQGYRNLFLDSHPDDGIAAGAKWERSLWQSLRQSRGVVALCTQSWLASPWCMAEAMMAREQGKPLFLLAPADLAAGAGAGTGAEPGPPTKIPEFLKDTQLIAWAAATEQDALGCLLRGLREAGLEDDFPLPARPYPGLEPFGVGDAAIFFGRDQEITGVLGILTRCLRGNAKRFVAVLGASGCGKSSLVSAGVLPRLQRAAALEGADRKWVILPPFAGGAGMGGLVVSLGVAFSQAGQPADLDGMRGPLRAGSDGGGSAERAAAALADLAGNLLAAHRIAGGCLLVIVDQLEEVLASASASDARAALRVLFDASALEGSPLVVLATIRSDFLNAFQLFPGAADRYEEITLDPTPKARFGELIEGPARRFGLSVEPGLVAELVEDTSRDDALPLLAFALERLYNVCGPQGVLTVDAYRQLFPPVTVCAHDGRRREYRGVSAAVKHVAERILDDAGYAGLAAQDPRILDLRRAFLGLARIGFEGQIVRKSMRRAALPASCTGVLERFVRQRLLVSSAVQGTVELTVAHESIFRVWDRLAGWLEDEHDFLKGKARIEQACADWQALPEPERDKGLLTGALLERARSWLAERLDYFDERELDLLRASIARDDQQKRLEAERREREARLQRRLARLGLAAAAIFAVIGGVAGWLGIQAKQAQQDAEQRSALLATNLARAKAEEGRVDESLLLLLDSAKQFNETNVPDEATIAFYRTLERAAKQSVFDIPPNAGIFQLEDAFYIVAPQTREMLRFDGTGAPEVIWTAKSPVKALQLHPNGRDLILVAEDLSVVLLDWRHGTQRDLGRLQPAPPPQSGTVQPPEIAIAKDGLVILQQTIDPAAAQAGESSVYYCTLDALTGHIANGVMAGEYELSYAPMTGGRRFLFGKMKYAPVEIAANGPAPHRQDRKRDKIDKRALQVYACFGRYDDRIAGFASAFDRAENWDYPVLRSACRMLDGRIAMTWEVPKSAGEYRIDRLLSPGAEPVDVKQAVNAGLTGLGRAVPDNIDAAFVDYNAGGRLVAIAVNRDLYFSEIGDDGQGTAGHWLKLPYHADDGRFFGGDKLAVIARGQGKVVVVDARFDEEAVPGFVQTKSLGAVESGGVEDGLPHGLATYHRGSCVGDSMALGLGSMALPSGEEIVLPEAGSEGGGILVKASGGTYRIPVAWKDSGCIQFSRDWQRLLVLADEQASVYDFAVARARKALDETPLVTLPAGRLTSAFFVGPHHDIVTSGWDGRAIRWSQADAGKEWVGSELYRGNLPLRYAEPDRDGNRVLLIEDAGMGMATGSLYSLRARDRLLDLGAEYKWLGLAFTEDFGIAVLRPAGGSRLVTLPDFPTLLHDAESALSPGCRPASPGDYRSSPCWPAESVSAPGRRDWRLGLK